jgi:hypothetical protein
MRRPGPLGAVETLKKNSALKSDFFIVNQLCARACARARTRVCGAISCY